MENLNVNELRANNIIRFKGLNEIQVVSCLNFQTDEIGTIDRPLGKSSFYEPILLTGEWLLNFGFIETKKVIRFLDYIDYRLGTCVATIITSGIEIEFCGLDIEDRAFIRKLNYVHELQNLYFALTGQELCVTQP